jgi:hypothetical protein
MLRRGPTMRRDTDARAVLRRAVFDMFRVAFFLLAISFSSISAVAQTPSSVAQSEAELRARLDLRTSISLTGSQIRSAASAIARSGDVALALDRRVDPETPIELNAVDLPLEQVWHRLVEVAGLGYATYGPIVYVGPQATARDLNTLAALRRDEAERAPLALKAKLLHVQETVCDAPCDVHELWNRLTADAGLKTVNPERMPFDLWPAIRWAPLPLVDRLTLIAVQFELTFRVDATARTITLEPTPKVVTLERSYAAGPKPQETLTRFRSLAPEAVMKAVGAKISVVGKFEDHQRLVAPAGAQVAIKPGVPPKAGGQVHSLRIKDVPLRALVQVLRDKHKLKIEVDDAAIAASGLSLDGHTAVDVEKVTLEQLLEQAAAPLGLTARTIGDTVVIGVRAKAPK